MHVLQAILSWLNDPAVKIALTFLGTFLLRRWPKFVDEAVPVWTLLGNIVTTLLGLLFGAHIPAGPSAMLMHAGGVHIEMVGGLAAAAVHVPWWKSLITDAILPWLLGYGGQRATGQTGTWLVGSGGKPKATAPEQRHPMDSVSSKH